MINAFKSSNVLRSLAVGLIAVAGGVSANYASVLSYDLAFSQADVQAKIDHMKPIKIDKLFFSMELPNPQARLIAASNEIEVSSNVVITPPVLLATKAGLPASWPGKVGIGGSIRYDAATGSFYLLNPRVTALEIDSVPERFKPKARELAQVAATHFLAVRPVYVIKDDNLKLRLAKAVLKSVRIQGDKVVVTLGM